ncbi:hypothetical protein ACPWT1_21365 [Ramlibacter sp. MMS24-I3-19]|uniref:hypothetical protein n=1 Tax=Ramlibacter sp. MMS24-I3-19 TaxID=3416606 RepID=UPI003D08F458
MFIAATVSADSSTALLAGTGVAAGAALPPDEGAGAGDAPGAGAGTGEATGPAEGDAADPLPGAGATGPEAAGPGAAVAGVGDGVGAGDGEPAADGCVDGAAATVSPPPPPPHALNHSDVNATSASRFLAALLIVVCMNLVSTPANHSLGQPCCRWHASLSRRTSTYAP